MDRAGEFPPPVYLTPASNVGVWRLADLEAHLEKRRRGRRVRKPRGFSDAHGQRRRRDAVVPAAGARARCHRPVVQCPLTASLGSSRGYAGTGKTTLAREIARRAGGEVAFAAFSGKAAAVMRQKGCADADTIDHLIYRPSSKSHARTPRPAPRRTPAVTAAVSVGNGSPGGNCGPTARSSTRGSSSSTNARWSMKIWRATCCRSACRVWSRRSRAAAADQWTGVFHQRRAGRHVDRGASAGLRLADHRIGDASASRQGVSPRAIPRRMRHQHGARRP